MKKVILSLDTSKSETTKVVLIVDGERFEKMTDAKHLRSQVVLPLIEEILNEQKLKLSDIAKIKVNAGPGSFTGLRVGLAVAQTLGKLLNIPVNGKPAGEVPVMYQESKWE